jgi:hypothetical protein
MWQRSLTGFCYDGITHTGQRNRLVHEYVENMDELAANLNEAKRASAQLTTTLERVAEALKSRDAPS